MECLHVPPMLNLKAKAFDAWNDGWCLPITILQRLPLLHDWLKNLYVGDFLDEPIWRMEPNVIVSTKATKHFL